MRRDADLYNYARALSRISTDTKELAQIQKDLAVFNEILVANKEALGFLKHPGIPPAEKTSFLCEITREGKFSPMAEGFLKLLISENKIEYLKDVLVRYDGILMAMNREIKVKVEAAYRQDKKTLEEIKEVLSKKFGRKITMEFSENGNLIGGFRIIADGLVFDGSVKGELERIKFLLADSV